MAFITDYSKEIKELSSDLASITQDYVINTAEDSLADAIYNVGYWNGEAGLNISINYIRYSSLVPILPNTYYKMTGVSSGVTQTIIYFDENENYVASTVYSEITNGVFKSRVDSIIKYARVNIHQDELANASLTQCNSDGIVSITGGNVLRDYIGSVYSQYWGKKANFMGDSITYGTYTPTGHASPDGFVTNPYPTLVGNKLGITTVRNYAHSGTSISSTSSINPALAMSAIYSTMDDDADLICVMGGTNDYGTNVGLGTIADTTDISFYGALDVLCNGLITKYKGKKIVFISPHHGLVETTNSAGATLAQYRQAIFDVCEKYGIPVIDGFALGITCANTTIKDTYVNDGLHPNIEGHKVVANNLVPRLNSI
jgi:lysophospholipase L1-like esterase